MFGISYADNRLQGTVHNSFIPTDLPPLIYNHDRNIFEEYIILRIVEDGRAGGTIDSVHDCVVTFVIGQIVFEKKYIVVTKKS